MYKSIRLATFKGMGKLDKESFENIKKIVDKKTKYGEISLYSPNENSFIGGTHENSLLNNRAFFSLKSEDIDSISILASYLVNELDKLNLDYDWVIQCPNVRIFFHDKEMPLEDFDKILAKPKKNGRVVRCLVIGDSFIHAVKIRFECQIDVFDELLEEILCDISELGYNYEIVFEY